jgi:hypothetical protein
MYEKAEDVEVLAWFAWSGFDGGVVIELYFDDDCEPETEGAERLEQED